MEMREEGGGWGCGEERCDVLNALAEAESLPCFPLWVADSPGDSPGELMLGFGCGLGMPMDLGIPLGLGLPPDIEVLADSPAVLPWSILAEPDPDPISAAPDPDWAAANPQRSAKTAMEMLILDILDIVFVGGASEQVGSVWSVEGRLIDGGGVMECGNCEQVLVRAVHAHVMQVS
jgi:hypothetical protein